MVCGVAHDPRVTIRYYLCCGPREAKGRAALRVAGSWVCVCTKEVSMARGATEHPWGAIYRPGAGLGCRGRCINAWGAE